MTAAAAQRVCDRTLPGLLLHRVRQPEKTKDKALSKSFNAKLVKRENDAFIAPRGSGLLELGLRVVAVRGFFVFVAIGALVICCVCCAVYVTLQHGASRPRAKTLPAWLSRGPSSWLQASRTPRVDFGEEGINMLTVRVSHQMASQI